MMIDANGAAAIASICAALVSIVVVIGQIIVARRVEVVGKLVNGQSHALNRITATEAFRDGVAAAGMDIRPTEAAAPPSIEAR